MPHILRVLIQGSGMLQTADKIYRKLGTRTCITQESLVWQKEVMTFCRIKESPCFYVCKHLQSWKIGIRGLVASKMAQQVKVLAAKADHLKSTPKTQKVKAENNSRKLSSAFHMLSVGCVHVEQTHTPSVSLYLGTPVSLPSPSWASLPISHRQTPHSVTAQMASGTSCTTCTTHALPPLGTGRAVVWMV